MQTHALLPHPDSPTASVNSIQVSVSLTPNNGLSFTYSLTGELSQLRIPEPATPTPTRADNLWRHTCFEAFIQGDDAPAYREFNFSPSGQWQVYAFTGYREGGLLEPAPIPTLVRTHKADRLILECSLPAEALPHGKQLGLGLTAVIEAADGTLSYWSLRHAPGKPDFHHTHAFALTLDRL
jgi:hypothetical protein